MAVATPLSLENIATEFGLGGLSTQTFNSGSGSVTAPADASAVRIKIWGGGGGGGNGGEFGVGGGGGGGGFILKTVNVTGGSTTASYSVGAGGFGNTGPAQAGGDNGVSSSVTINSTTYTGNGGFGGDGGGAGGSGGGNSGNGDVNESGVNGDSGGAAGGTEYGGGGGSSVAPGSGGNGGNYSSDNGADGRVVFEWLFKGLSTYTRGSGEIANHSANASIPTSASNLGIAQFDGAEKSFTATITSADISGTQNPPTTYATRGFNDVYGSINRSQVGINRNNTSSTNLLSVVETPGIFYDLLGNPSGYIFGVTASFSGDVRSSTLGYDFFSSISINGLNGGSIGIASQSYDGTKTTFGFLGGFSQGFGANGSSNSVEIVYGGP